MVDNIEISPSDRAKCQKCGKKIGKGTPRGVIATRQSYGYSNYYYCYKCAELKIKEGIEELKEHSKELKRLIKKTQKEIIIMELENGNKC